MPRAPSIRVINCLGYMYMPKGPTLGYLEPQAVVNLRCAPKPWNMDVRSLVWASTVT